MDIEKLRSSANAVGSFARLGLRDALSGGGNLQDPASHLESALKWLMRAQDMGGEGGGVSYGYSIRGAWRPPYIETTGFIATTFFRLAALRNDRTLFDRAIRMADWLLEVQKPNGSFGNSRFSSDGIVFDTGQDLFGLVRAHRETGESRYFEAGERAGSWLVEEAADADGRWTQYTHLGVPHVYNTRVAWALLQLNAEAPSADRERVARANLDWALSQQQRSGLYTQCAFKAGVAPFTHTIAYAIRGLWEAGQLLGDERYRDSAVRAADALLPHVNDDGFIPGRIDPDGIPAARYCCLTGNAQLSIVWAKLFRATGSESYRKAAARSIRYVMAKQDLDARHLEQCGAIKGSHPSWGRYSPLTYPNWATKFFVDAMLECWPWI